MLQLIGRVAKLVQVTVEKRYEYQPISDKRGSRSKVMLKGSEKRPGMLRVEKGQPGVVLKYNRSIKAGSNQGLEAPGPPTTPRRRASHLDLSEC